MNRVRTATCPIVLAGVVAVCASCALHERPTIAPAKMLELWQEPTGLERRDLLHGPGGAALAPSPRERYTLLDADETGFSRGYDVRDSRGRKWSVKLGPEARTEVVVSRLLWAIGYRQPAVYHLPRWTLAAGGRLSAQPAARFRLDNLEKVGEWSWRENPFVGTRPFAGLFVLMVMVNNWDVKTSQNAIYEVDAGAAPRRLYVVKDIGASFGRTSWWVPGTRDDVEGFEDEPFIESVEGNRVRFHYKGAWLEPQLTRSVTPGDVVWTCELLERLSPRQWLDAFRAGGYTEAEARRFIRRMHAKIEEGLKLRAVP